jgi:predicted ArsR family transcriptional regulator
VKPAPGNDVASQLAALLREKGSLSNSEAQVATGLDAATIRTHLQALVADGRARTEGQRRGMRYIAVG